MGYLDELRHEEEKEEVIGSGPNAIIKSNVIANVDQSKFRITNHKSVLDDPHGQGMCSMHGAVHEVVFGGAFCRKWGVCVLGIFSRESDHFLGQRGFPLWDLTTFWPLSQKPKIGQSEE